MHRLLSTSLLALGLWLASACESSDSTGPSGGTTAEPNDVDIVRGASTLTTTAFDPNPKTLSLGSATSVSVRWVNRDGGSGYGGGTPVAHQIASNDGAFATSATLAAGGTYSVAFTQAGTYQYHCAIHPNMVGTVTVGP